MAEDSKGQGSEGASQPAKSNGMSTDYEHKASYGDEAAWTNVVWIIIGIVCACGLAVLLFMRVGSDW